MENQNNTTTGTKFNNDSTSEHSTTMPANFGLGRPSDPNSARQVKLRELEERKANGYVPKRGRPTVEGSANQLSKAEKEAALKAKIDQLIADGVIKDASEYVPEKGRPVDPNSPRQIKLREQAIKKQQREAAWAALQNKNINVTVDEPAVEEPAVEEPVKAGKKAKVN